MITITIWLLVSIGGGAYAGTPTGIIERFKDVEECQRVANIIYNVRSYQPAIVKCIQATVLK